MRRKTGFWQSLNWIHIGIAVSVLMILVAIMGLALLAVFTPAGSSIVAEIFATPTPTPTATERATPTPVPTATPLPTDTPTPTLTPTLTPTRTPTNTPTITRIPPTRAPATPVPPSATPVPPTLPPTNTLDPANDPSQFLDKITFEVVNPETNTTTWVIFRFYVHNNRGFWWEYGYLGVNVNEADTGALYYFQASWTNSAFDWNQGLSWEDHVIISKPGQYNFYLVLCYSYKNFVCDRPGEGQWITLAGPIFVTIH